MKLILLPIIILLTVCACKQKSENIIKIEGEAQGTTYHISYLADEGINFKPDIDSILRKIDSSMSTYLPVSIISRINRNDSTAIPDAHFVKVFNKSMEISDKTDGYFDITVAPLINARGFGNSKKQKVDSATIDSLLRFVGFKKLSLSGNKIKKESPEVMLDFNAIAQGYSVDVIGDFLESKGIKNYFVELGGEVKAKGNKANKEEWKVGIDQPDDNSEAQRKIQAIIKLSNKALATSGNYRKFYVENGQKYSHIIEPKTGYTSKNNLLSASVVADDCMTADAFATAFMVMGLEKSKQFLEANKALNLEVFFIYDDKGEWKTYSSDYFKNRIEELR